MKKVIIVCGYSGSGKSTLVRLGSCRRQIEGYHIAAPFKAMMYSLWKVDVDDRDIRENHRPNGRETVGELMASAFEKFREWDPDILMPGLYWELEMFGRKTISTQVLAIDGVRTVSEVNNILIACDIYGLSVEAVEVVREGLTGERWETIDIHINQTIGYLVGRLGSVQVLRNKSALEDWKSKCSDFWDSKGFS